MNLLKPQKILFNNLTEITDLPFETQDCEEIENRMLCNQSYRNLDIYKIDFKIVHFKDIEILESKLEKNTFIDVIFEKCNFSNTSFDNCTFIRCEFVDCKITGCTFLETVLSHVSFIETNANYLNLSMASLENVLFEKTLLRNSNFQENKVKNLAFEEVDLTQSRFFKTSLRNVDLSNSILEGFSVSIDDIKGATIDMIQSIDLLYLLDVKIK